MRPGSGEMIINGRTIEDYFPNNVLRMVVRQPLQLTETTEKFDINVSVEGGGCQRPGRSRTTRYLESAARLQQ